MTYPFIPIGLFIVCSVVVVYLLIIKRDMKKGKIYSISRTFLQRHLDNNLLSSVKINTTIDTTEVAAIAIIWMLVMN